MHAYILDSLFLSLIHTHTHTQNTHAGIASTRKGVKISRKLVTVLSELTQAVQVVHPLHPLHARQLVLVGSNGFERAHAGCAGGA